MNIINKKINKIIFFSFFIKLIFVIFNHEKFLSDEWGILYENFQNFKSYSYYVFGNQNIPSSYLPPLYLIFIYINKILSFGKIDYLYLIYFNQILISSLSVYLFYKLCKNFLNDSLSLFGTFIFSVFPLIVYSNGLISSACLQLFFYLLFFNLFLKIFTNDLSRRNLFYLTITSALTLILRGEFLIILLFSLIYITVFNRKKFFQVITILTITIILVSPYLIRNYLNTGNIHLVNVTGYALWKGNNQMANVEGFHNPLHPNDREAWPKHEEFASLYDKLDKIDKDKQYEINRDKIFKEEAINNIFLDKKKYLILYFKKVFSYYFIDFNSTLKNYYHPAHIIPILLFSICSIPGAVIGLKKIKNSKIIYIFLLTCFLTAFISIFFILPRYKISIISSQILFSFFFFEYLFEKFFKNRLKK